MILQPLPRQVGDKSLKKKEFILPFSTGQLSGCVFTVGGWWGGGALFYWYIKDDYLPCANSLNFPCSFE